MTQAIHRADPLIWGEGPRLFEMFLEPTCPFCVRTLGKLDALLDAAGRDRVSVRIWLHSQPWHMFSGVIVRAVLAASMLPGGRDNARAVLDAIAPRREEFEFEKHCRGPNMDATPAQIIARLENYTGLSLAKAFEFPELEAEIKKHTRYARQNGIHVSPTFLIDGLVQADMGSGDPVEDWAHKLTA
ncbi:DsbA family protein [Novosphingobium guangzhouense]|uniref:Thioredoxin n=1 Tax=Novosphingobium guangzhouense TaxID=1850347 RepID=A0A2K2G619_9SPHN|nr:thioredoxin [Novosphingobium guangzhouense]PNU06428.1 thioredoxin [Novosphingobium guangzhouense]